MLEDETSVNICNTEGPLTDKMACRVVDHSRMLSKTPVEIQTEGRMVYLSTVVVVEVVVVVVVVKVEL